MNDGVYTLEEIKTILRDTFSSDQTICTSSLRQMQRRGECGRRSMVEAVEVGGRRLRGCCCYSATAPTLPALCSLHRPPLQPRPHISLHWYSHEGGRGGGGGMRGILMDKVAVGHQKFKKHYT